MDISEQYEMLTACTSSLFGWLVGFWQFMSSHLILSIIIVLLLLAKFFVLFMRLRTN